MRARGALRVCTLLAAMTPVSAHADSSAELSIPEPTELGAAVAAGTTFLWTQAAGEIRSSDATAVITAIDVAASGGQRMRGIRIALRSSHATDDIYLGEPELRHFRIELAELDSQFEDFHSRCEAISNCVTGVARCRPSQTEPQAYCPGIYATPGVLKGFGLSTSRQSFLFPHVPPEKFMDSIDSAIEALERSIGDP